MSVWGTIDARFELGDSKMVRVEHLNEEFEQGDARLTPTGSEEGPSASEHTGGVISVNGRLRDVSDLEDSFVVLAWFIRHARWCEKSTLTWEIDSGPRYRYVLDHDGLRRLRGVLE